MAAKLLTSQLQLQLELMHNETCRISRLETITKPLMILPNRLIKVDDSKKIYRVKVSVRDLESHYKSCCNFKENGKRSSMFNKIGNRTTAKVIFSFFLLFRFHLIVFPDIYV